MLSSTLRCSDQISSWSLYDGLGSHAQHQTVHWHTDHSWRRSRAPRLPNASTGKCLISRLLMFSLLRPGHGPAHGHQVLWAKGVPEELGLGFGYDVCRVKRCPDLSAILSVRKSSVQLASHFSAIMSLVLGLAGIQSLMSWITDINSSCKQGPHHIVPKSWRRFWQGPPKRSISSRTSTIIAFVVEPARTQVPQGLIADWATGCLELDHQAAGGTQI